MVVDEILPEEVLSGCRAMLGLPPRTYEGIDETLIVALLRRCAGFLCPCSRAALRAALLESLSQLGGDPEELPGRIDDAIEGLIIVGDLLELNDVATVDPAVKGTWVFAAPPSFVVRPSGSVFLMGIVTDQDTFLPQSLASRVEHDGLARLIATEPAEDLPRRLQEHGVRALPESVWLKSPKPMAATELKDQTKARLDRQSPCGNIKDLLVLDPARPVTYYRGRWVPPGNDMSGIVVGRRPQEFGAPLWCCVSLSHGEAERFVDFPFRGMRWRGCDVAWHLQLAIDHLRSAPQLYRHSANDAGIRFDFFSPLPQWAQRRFMIFGHAGSGGAGAFLLPTPRRSGHRRKVPSRSPLDEAERRLRPDGAKWRRRYRRQLRNLHGALRDYIEATYHISARSSSSSGKSC